MHKNFGKFFVLGLLMLSHNLLAQAMFDCKLLVGTWVGEYTYEDGQYNKWEAVYAEQGGLSIDFFDASGALMGSESGSWQCDGVWVETVMKNREEEYRFRYQVKALDAFRYVYASTEGPVFTSYRKPKLQP